MGSQQSGKHIVLTVFGSLGDLHPVMALGFGLQRRGHRVTIATSEYYREKLEASTLDFYPVRPAFDIPEEVLIREIFDPVRGPEILMRKYMLPASRDTLADLRPLLETADFLVNSTMVMPGPLLAQQMNLPWASVALQPFLYFSAYDPPLLPVFPFTEHCMGWGPDFWRGFLNWSKSVCKSWPRELYKIRDELGLPDRGNPMFEGQFSPYLNLAMFSKALSPVQPDWPAHSEVSGFVFYDEMVPGESDLPEAVRAFLEAGEPPVVFALGSSAVKIAGNFYRESIQAVERLGCRAVFVCGENILELPDDKRMLAWPALPYSKLFPHAAAVVHQGGIGTTAQVLRAGKPMVVVPFAFDQPDNALRMKRLGVSRTISRGSYSARRAAKALGEILTSSDAHERAQAISRIIASEDGVETACRLIEARL